MRRLTAGWDPADTSRSRGVRLIGDVRSCLGAGGGQCHSHRVPAFPDGGDCYPHGPALAERVRVWEGVNTLYPKSHALQLLVVLSDLFSPMTAVPRM